MSIATGLESVPATPQPVVRPADRLWDLAALTLVVGGAGLFVFARRALASLGDGTYTVAKGVTYVSRADYHLAQTRIGSYCIAMGVVVGVVAALRHRLRAR
jgi:hypothetical protein